MLLSSAGRADGPIPAETRKVAGLLAREKTGEILAHLYRRPYLSASEVARLEDVHVATAQRYLKELADAGLLGCRLRERTTRPTEEYWLLEPRITIQIDLEESDDGDTMAQAARRIAVRERGAANVVYDTNPRTGDVEGLLILSDAQPRLVEERIRLSAAMGRFLAQLPYSAGNVQSIWDVMERAGLAEEHLPEILASIGRFTGRRRGAKPPAVDGALSDDRHEGNLDADGDNGPASARPLDPELEDLFRTLAHRNDPLIAAPAVPILEVVPVEPAPADEGPPDPLDPSAPAERPKRTTPGPRPVTTEPSP